MKTLLTTALSFLISASAFGAVDVRFSGACSGGDFDAQGGDIEYFNLDLDLLEGAGNEKKECIMTTTIPQKPGFFINVSQFLAQGAAEIDGNGLVSLFVNHRFNNQDAPGKRDIARNSRNMTVSQTAIGVSRCNEKVVLRTRLTATAKDAFFLQDKATSNNVKYRFSYVRCH
jgi:hypothetical protein